MSRNERLLHITTDEPFSRDTFPIFGQERMVQVGNPVQRKFDVTIYAMNQLGLIKTFISNAWDIFDI